MANDLAELVAEDQDKALLILVAKRLNRLAKAAIMPTATCRLLSKNGRTQSCGISPSTPLRARATFTPPPGRLSFRRPGFSRASGPTFKLFLEMS